MRWKTTRVDIALKETQLFVYIYKSIHGNLAFVLFSLHFSPFLPPAYIIHLHINQRRYIADIKENPLKILLFIKDKRYYGHNEVKALFSNLFFRDWNLWLCATVRMQNKHLLYVWGKNLHYKRR